MRHHIFRESFLNCFPLTPAVYFSYSVLLRILSISGKVPDLYQKLTFFKLNLKTAIFKEHISVPVSGHKHYGTETKKTKKQLKKRLSKMKFVVR